MGTENGPGIEPANESQRRETERGDAVGRKASGIGSLDGL